MLTWICWSRFNLKLFVKASCMIFFYDDICEFFYILLDSHSCMISLKDANRLFIIMFLVSMVWTDLHLSHILGIPHEIHEQRQRINLDSQPTLAFCRLLYTTWTDLYWHSLDWFLFFLFFFWCKSDLSFIDPCNTQPFNSYFLWRYCTKLYKISTSQLCQISHDLNYGTPLRGTILYSVFFTHNIFFLHISDFLLTCSFEMRDLVYPSLSSV